MMAVSYRAIFSDTFGHKTISGRVSVACLFLNSWVATQCTVRAKIITELILERAGPVIKEGKSAVNQSNLGTFCQS